MYFYKNSRTHDISLDYIPREAIGKRGSKKGKWERAFIKRIRGVSEAEKKILYLCLTTGKFTYNSERTLVFEI